MNIDLQLPRGSAANIIVPELPAVARDPAVYELTAGEFSALLNDLRRLIADSSQAIGSKNQLLIEVIKILIAAGVVSGPRIVGAAAALGFDRRHAGAILAKSAAPRSRTPEWRKNEAGTYEIIDRPVLV